MHPMSKFTPPDPREFRSYVGYRLHMAEREAKRARNRHAARLMIRLIVLVILCILAVLSPLFVTCACAATMQGVSIKAPVVTPCETSVDAFLAAKKYQFEHGINGIVRRVSNTGSMRPLMDESYCLTEFVPFSESLVGEVIEFSRSNTRYVCHFAVAKDRYGYITSGYANRHADAGRVTAENFNGVIRRVWTWNK